MTTDDWEAVFWDIGGVILDIDSVERAHKAFMTDLVERHDIDTSTEEALTTWQTVIGDYFRVRDGTAFRPARDAYQQAVNEIVGRRVEQPNWFPKFTGLLEESIQPQPGAVETIHELADRDLHLGVISDVDSDEGTRILESFGVRDIFDSITTSEEVGRTKPDPAIYKTALEKADVSARNSLMIGDRYKHDMSGASAVGMCTVAYGAEEGEHVDYRVENLQEVLNIVR